MRLIIVFLFSWLLGVVVCLFLNYLIYREDFTFNDLIPGVTMLTAAAILAFALIATPSMFWLRRRLKGYQPMILFPLVACSVLTIPVLIFSGMGILLFRAIAISEAILFCSAFLVMGAAFGLSFVWCYRRNTIYRPQEKEFLSAG